MPNKKIWIIILVMFLLLLAPIFYLHLSTKSVEIDLQTILENEDFSINGLPWFCTFNNNKLFNRTDVVKQVRGKDFELRLANMKIIGIDANVSGLFMFPRLPQNKGDYQLAKINLYLVFKNEESYSHFIKTLENSVINAASINTSLRSAISYKKEELLQPIKQLQQGGTQARWYGSEISGDLKGRYLFYLDVYHSNSDFKRYGDDTWTRVIMKFGTELYSPSLQKLEQNLNN